MEPIGREPDLNDGVRLNIHPFITADVLRSDPVFAGVKIGARIRLARPGGKNVSTTVISPWPKNRLCDRKQS